MRHVRTGYELDILTKYLYGESGVVRCNDCTDYVLPLDAGRRGQRGGDDLARLSRQARGRVRLVLWRTGMTDRADFLPVSARGHAARGWWWYDFLVVGGDAYIDHPSFGTAVIARVLEAEGFRVAVLCQPDWHSAEAFARHGRPRLGVMIGAGNLDSMVAHYTASKHPAARTSTPRARRRACGPTGPSPSTPTARARPSRACPSS